jgi:hypothetical protein
MRSGRRPHLNTKFTRVAPPPELLRTPVLLCYARRPPTEGGPGIAGSNDRRGTAPPPNASGYAAGFTIVLCIAAGMVLGAAIGALVGATVPLLLAGAALGVVAGFYAVWVRFFKTR